MRQSSFIGILLLTVVQLVDASVVSRGSIAGTVVNREDGQTLIGANVVVQGTVLGTTTDREGRFLLRRVPAGRHALAVSMIGYHRKVITDIIVEPEQVVEVRIELEPGAIQTEPIVVTASKREQSLEEVPVSVSVVDARALSYRNTVTIDQSLRYVPGVNFTDAQINIRGSSGYSRGVGTRVLLLLDGLPLLSGDTGEIIWESIPVQQIDRIEVVKGAGSALYGSSALGGVINVISRNIGQQPATRVRVYGGAYERPRHDEWKWTDDMRFFSGAQISHERRLGDLSLLLAGSRIDDDGYRQNDFRKRWHGSVRLGYDFSPFESLTLSYGFMHQRRGNFLFWKNLENALVPLDDQLVQRVQSTRWNLSGGFKQFLFENFFYTTKVVWYRTRWEDNIPNALNEGGNHSTADFVNGEFQGVFQLSETQTLTFGFSGTLNTVTADTIFGKRTGRGGGAYFQDEILLADELRLSIGGRFDAQKLEGADAVSQFNPKLGASYKPLEATTLRMSVGRGFRAPSIAEVFTTTEAAGVTVRPNPKLRAERSWSFEVGVMQGLSDNLLAEASLFQNEFWDLIEPTFDPDGFVRFRNVTRARIQGAEFGLKLNFLDGLLLGDVGYTYIFPKDVGQGGSLKYRPRHLLYASGRIGVNYLQLGIDFRYLSKVERIDDELVKLNIVSQGDKRVPVYVTDARASLDWEFVQVPLVTTFHVNNVFQYYYVELIGNIAPIRNFVFTVEAKL